MTFQIKVLMEVSQKVGGGEWLQDGVGRARSLTNEKIKGDKEGAEDCFGRERKGQ